MDFVKLSEQYAKAMTEEVKKWEGMLDKFKNEQDPETLKQSAKDIEKFNELIGELKGKHTNLYDEIEKVKVKLKST